VAGFCEHIDESLGYIKAGTLLTGYSTGQEMLRKSNLCLYTL
jgi:hypothetical protein